MLKNENIICISSIDWDFVWQGHQEIMSTFAKNGNRVLFIENTGVRNPNIRDFSRLIKRVKNWGKSVKGYREVMDNVYTLSPVVLPFPFSKTARLINKRLIIKSIKKWMNAIEFYNPVIWTFLPTGLALDIINCIDKKLLVYYCIADFEELAGNSKNIKLTEEKVIRSCDLVFAQGKILEKKCKKFNENVSVFPFGVNIDVFEDCKVSNSHTPDDIKDINKPIIGYVGGVHRHIDYGLICDMARQNPGWSIVFIGPIQVDVSKTEKFPNIYFLGKKAFESLPGYLSRFDVCIIPYKLTEYTKTVYPTKMNEYHALGKPVVSTSLPEVVEFNKTNNNIVRIAGNDKFVNRVNDALNDNSDIFRNERINSARVNSWPNRIEQMSDLIELAIQNKPKNEAIDWQAKLIKIYKLSRRNVLLPALIVATLWAAIFYTPLIWAIAYPLKISDVPKKTDVIAVFGGGVGESGSFGKSTIERARYGAELYNKNYASNIIFSSGYTATYNDAESMKLIATSLGVPKENIILDKKGSRAFENVKYVAIIMRENGWRSVLIVSSQYNMLRVALVFRNNDDSINEVLYTPVLNSQFYSNSGKRWDQFRAIMHEYLGIIYYWWKGYI